MHFSGSWFLGLLRKVIEPRRPPLADGLEEALERKKSVSTPGLSVERNYRGTALHPGATSRRRSIESSDLLGKLKEGGGNSVSLAVRNGWRRPSDDVSEDRPNLRELSRAVSGDPPLFEYVGRGTGSEDIELTDSEGGRLRIWLGNTGFIPLNAMLAGRNRKRVVD